jgi:lipoyl(octanoyl) transferase
MCCLRSNAVPSPSLTDRVLLRDLGLADYAATVQAMRDFTDRRDRDTPDEIWLLQHPPVYTLGMNAKQVAFDNPSGIPVVHTDRGGDITYHGPGQRVAYVLMDLRRRAWGVKTLVTALEQTVIDILDHYGLAAARRPGAPGVYVDGRKIAQLGLRVRRGASYHGLSFNLAMDLSPFGRIHPCGYQGLETIDLAGLLPEAKIAQNSAEVDALLVKHLLRNLGYHAQTD